MCRESSLCFSCQELITCRRLGLCNTTSNKLATSEHGIQLCTYVCMCVRLFRRVHSFQTYMLYYMVTVKPCISLTRYMYIPTHYDYAQTLINSIRACVQLSQFKWILHTDRHYKACAHTCTFNLIYVRTSL